MRILHKEGKAQRWEENTEVIADGVDGDYEHLHNILIFRDYPYSSLITWFTFSEFVDTELILERQAQRKRSNFNLPAVRWFKLGMAE